MDSLTKTDKNKRKVTSAATNGEAEAFKYDLAHYLIPAYQVIQGVTLSPSLRAPDSWAPPSPGLSILLPLAPTAHSPGQCH